jgi:hypothetical protein
MDTKVVLGELRRLRDEIDVSIETLRRVAKGRVSRGLQPVWLARAKAQAAGGRSGTVRKSAADKGK